MSEENTARELGIFRQQLVRHRSLAASIARQEEIDSTSPPLRYVSYDADRGARASMDGGTISVPIITNGAIALGSSVISTGGVLDGRPRVVREERRTQERVSSTVAYLLEALEESFGGTSTPVTTMPQTILYLRVNNRTIELLNIDSRIANRRSNGITPLFFSIVDRPRKAVIVQVVTTAAETLGLGSDETITHTPVRLHTWILNASNGQSIASHIQILGNRTANQTWSFGNYGSIDFEAGNAMTLGLFPKAIEYPAALAAWGQHLITSSLVTFGNLTAHRAVQPQSWARPDIAGFYPFINPTAVNNQLTRLRVLYQAVGYQPTLPGLFGSSSSLAIETAPAADVETALNQPDTVFRQRKRLTQRTDLIADHPAFSAWGFTLETYLTNLFYPFNTFNAPGTIGQLLTATPTDQIQSARTDMIFANVMLPGGADFIERRSPYRYFRLLNALGVP